METAAVKTRRPLKNIHVCVPLERRRDGDADRRLLWRGGSRWGWGGCQVKAAPIRVVVVVVEEEEEQQQREDEGGEDWSRFSLLFLIPVHMHVHVHGLLPLLQEGLIRSGAGRSSPLTLTNGVVPGSCALRCVFGERAR